MQYQFDEPFLVDSTKINTLLGVHATPIEQALADTLACYSHQAPAPDNHLGETRPVVGGPPAGLGRAAPRF